MEADNQESQPLVLDYCSSSHRAGIGHRLGVAASSILVLQMPWMIAVLIVDTFLIGGTDEKGPSRVHILIHLILTFLPCMAGIVCGICSIKMVGHRKNLAGIVGLYGQCVFILYPIIRKLTG